MLFCYTSSFIVLAFINTFTEPRMLVLRAWSACWRNSKRKPNGQVSIRSKLGGNTLGLAELPNQQDVVATLRSLQRQVHSILKHASRPHKHVRLFAQDFELSTPKFAFRDELDAEHAKLVSKKLASCSVLDVMYGGDDMDQYALSTLEAQYEIDFDDLIDGEDVGGLIITPKTPQSLLVQPEMEVWARRHKVELLMTHDGFELQALGDLSVFPHLERISVPRASMLSWDVGRCKLSWARLHSESDITKLACVPSFHRLFVEVEDCLPLGLERLSQLKELSLDADWYYDEDYHDYLNINWAVLANLTNLETLEICGNFVGSLPLEICQLTSLKRLRVDSTDFVGSIPTELGRLTRLEKLALTGNKLLTDIPSCVFQIAALRSVCLDKALCKAMPGWEVSKRSKDYLEYKPII